MTDGALYEARPLARDGYKVQFARTPLRRAIIELCATALPAS